MRWFQLTAGALLAAALFSAAPAAPGQGISEIIVLEGDAAPDADGTFLSFDNSVLNATGLIAFRADLVGTANDIGIFLGSGGALTQAVREGQAPPLGPGTFLTFDPPRINASGQVAFKAALQGAGVSSVNDTGIYRGSGGALTQIVREDFIGATDLASPALNDLNQVSFKGTYLAVFPSLRTLWLGPGTAIAREGDAAPDGNGSFSSFGSPAINGAPRVAFKAVLTGTSGGTTDDTGVFVGSGGPRTRVAREGQAAPDANGTFSVFDNAYALNDTGQVAFKADLIGTSGGGADDGGVFRGSGGALTRMVREGDPAPDGNGTLDVLNPPAMNASGQVAVVAGLTGTSGGAGDDQAIYRGSGGALTRIVREGDLAPDGNGTFESFGETAINAAGEVLFFAQLAGTGGGTSDDSGIFLGDGTDIIRVAREGDALLGGTMGVPHFTTGVGVNAKMRSGFNDAGQAAYHADLAGVGQALLRFTAFDRSHWTSPAGGSWSAGGNWTGGVVPGAMEAVFIDPDSGLTVTFDAASGLVGSLTIGSTDSGVAVLDLSGGDLEADVAVTIHSRGRIVVGAGRVLTAPVLSNSGTLASGGVDAQVDAVLSNLAGGEVNAGAGRSLWITGAGSHANAGRIEAIGGEIRFLDALTNAGASAMIAGEDATYRFDGGLANDAAVALSFGTSRVFGDVVSGATGTIAAGGNSEVTFYDDVTNGGTLNVAAGSTAVFFGTLSGNGNVGTGDVQSLGDLLPGSSPGVMSFGGDLGFGLASRLLIELGGTAPGTGHDQVAVGGTATLAGTLDVALIDAFVPAYGDRFTILTAGDVQGAFDSEQLPILGGILDWDVQIDTVSVALEVIAHLLLGDANNDGAVTADDLIAVQQHFGSTGPADGVLLGDANDDGAVTADDLIAVQQHYGNTLSLAGGAPVPEPGGLALIGLLAVVLFRRGAWPTRRPGGGLGSFDEWSATNKVVLTGLTNETNTGIKR